VVARAIAVRECEARDLGHFDQLGGVDHTKYCRAQFARGPRALTILVAVDEKDTPIGKVHLDFEERADQNAAVLIAACVEKSARDRGIGTDLMAAAERHVCSRGVDTIVLGVEDWNTGARRLYERLGYVVIGNTDFKYAGAPVPNPGVWMRKELEC
jgi:ribosomal protein S18 acetylase RimI-like enzyme